MYILLYLLSFITGLFVVKTNIFLSMFSISNVKGRGFVFLLAVFSTMHSKFQVYSRTIDSEYNLFRLSEVLEQRKVNLQRETIKYCKWLTVGCCPENMLLNFKEGRLALLFREKQVGCPSD